MTVRWVLCLVVAGAACGGSGQPAPAEDVSTPQGVVRSFMQAVADSNPARMATFWGTASGSAAQTGTPPDYQRRMEITQLYLKAASFQILADDPGAVAGTREVVVELNRGQCTRQVPFQTVQTGSGKWLVMQIDLNTAGSPATPCEAQPKPEQ